MSNLSGPETSDAIIAGRAASGLQLCRPLSRDFTPHLSAGTANADGILVSVVVTFRKGTAGFVVEASVDTQDDESQEAVWENCCADAKLEAGRRLGVDSGARQVDVDAFQLSFSASSRVKIVVDGKSADAEWFSAQPDLSCLRFSVAESQVVIAAAGGDPRRFEWRSADPRDLL